MEKKTQQKVALNEIDYAYAVFDSYIEAFKRVTLAKPEEKTRLENQLKIECLKKLPKLYGALTLLTIPEHQPIIYAFFTAMVEVIESWSQAKK